MMSATITKGLQIRMCNKLCPYANKVIFTMRKPSDLPCWYRDIEEKGQKEKDLLVPKEMEKVKAGRTDAC